MDHIFPTFRTISKFKSLSFQLLSGMIVWLFFALVFTGYTLLLSWELENGGMAINDAGSLRKRTFQMALLHNQAPDSAALHHEQIEFEQVLLKLRKVGQGKLFLPDNQELQTQVQQLERRWYDQMLPWYAQLTTQHQTIEADNRQVLDDYANAINSVVKLIEEDNTRNIRLLRLFQMLLLFMTFVTAFTGIFLLMRLVIRPLDQLRAGIVRLSDGKLGTRIVSHEQNEFGLVSKGFNQMAEGLEDLYTNLENKVTEKTQALGEKNLELSNLYAVTAYLNEAHTTEEMSRGFVERLVRLSDAQGGCIRLYDPILQKWRYLASFGLDDEIRDVLQSGDNAACACTDLYRGQLTHIFTADLSEKDIVSCAREQFAQVMMFPIRFHIQEIGVLNLYFAHDQRMSRATERVIEALCTQLAVAIENHRLIARDRQFAVVEERNLMAQGLHDSIAQSLSFLNLQVQMLEDALNNQEGEQAKENLAFIKDGVQESYEDVRELLLNFRTRLSQQDFAQATQTVLQRFEQQARITTRLTTQGGECWLSPQQQLQVIFILQEALSNVRKHAHAQHVRVEIDHNANDAGDFKMRIIDDGVGFNAQDIADKRIRHVGTAIMQERAQRAHAQLNIQSTVGEGTQIELILSGKEYQQL